MQTDAPFFSIIIPAYERRQRLIRCLQAITELHYPRERFEVVVVDDGSRVPLAPVADPFRQQLNLTWVKQENGGPAVARNKGAEQAKGQFLAFTDDDCAPAPTWLSQFETQFAETPEAMIGGYTVNALPRNPFSITSQLLIDYLYHHFNRTESNARFFTSNNFALPAELFWSIGGFDITMPLAAGEDREFCDRWLQHGHRMIYLPKAVIYHAHRLDPVSFWRQHFNYGRGAWLYRSLRSRRHSERMRLEPFSFYIDLLTFPLTMARDVRAIILTGMLAITQTANAIGFGYESLLGARREKQKRPSTERVLPNNERLEIGD